MKPYPPEPLSPEERELAQLTARLGPQGEPSPALDARVLAAAHAALQPARAASSSRRKPRWPVALGLAASMVLAVGIAWQLRPLQSPPVIVAAEAPAPAQSPPEVQTPSAMVAAPASAEAETTPMAEVAQAPASPANPTEIVAKSAPRPTAPPPSAPTPVLADRGSALPGDAPVRAGQRAAKSTAAVDGAVVAQNRIADRYQSAAPPPPAPPAPVAMPAPAFAEEPSIAFAPSPQEEAAADSQSVDAPASALAGNARAAVARPVAAREAAAKASAASAQSRENATLDRVEVTGSRLKRTDLQVPVSDDAQLPVNEWLERVRTRYGLGDAGAAKKSLLLFVKDHPRETVPDDLEPLLEK